MEAEEETKPCSNCKREIPCCNLTMHELHCARNIAACPTCKEPVPRVLMQHHQDTMHTLVPCKQCGESVCGTDLEDHIRDSCANTIKSCRFCSLELPRRAQPAHESYCGARTERCADCGEYVMMKYRQLHLDSNHGFLRLEDDPVPRNEIKPIKATQVAKPSVNKSAQNPAPKTALRRYNDTKSDPAAGDNNNGPSTSGATAQNATNGAIAKTAVKNAIKTKKRPAPAPPREPAPLATRDLPYYSARARAQREERDRLHQNNLNAAMGLPPVLNAAEKLEKLRKMAALANRETEPPDYRDKLRGQVWMTPNIPAGNVLGNARPSDRDDNTQNNEKERDSRPDLPQEGEAQAEPSRTNDKDDNTQHKGKKRDKGKNIKKPNQPNGLPTDEEEIKRARQEFKNLKPMTPQEFIVRFNEMQMRNGEPAVNNDERRNDRISEIKSSLRELRRGLNEVTAPYNANANAANNNVQNNHNEPEPDLLPCEFCTELIAPDDLVLHQTGCRPDLAQFRPGPNSAPVEPPRNYYDEPVIPCEFCMESLPVYLITEHQTGCRPDLAQFRPGPDSAPVEPPRNYYDEPVIPCEFCMESLPVYLITEHQERCGREANLLYPD